MAGFTDLLNSERGLFAIVLIVAATVLAALKLMSIADWQTFAMAIFGIYAGGKTITGAVAIMKGSAPAPAAVPPAAPTKVVTP